MSMSLTRDCEFKNTHFGFTDEYGQDKELAKRADRIIRAVTASPYKEAWIPLVQGEEATLTKDIVDQMKADSKVAYVLADSIKFDGYEPKYVFTDGSYMDKVGAIDQNVLIMKLDDSFSKDGLLKLIEKSADAVEDSKVAEARREYEKAQVQKFIDGRIKAKRIEIDRDSESTREMLKAVSNQLIFHSRRLEELELMRLAYKESPEENARVEAEISELFQSTKLKGVRFDEDTVTFTTREIEIKDEGGKVHPLGEFEVKVTMSNSDVRFYNKSNKLTDGGTIPHPHCSEEGKPCLGNIATVLPELIAHYDILAMWQILLSFLQSHNPTDGWGARLIRWPSYDPATGAKFKAGTALNQPVSEREEEEPERETWYCDACHEDHYADEREQHTCPICGDTFCEESEDHEEYNGVDYCSHDCVSAKKASEGVA